MTMPLYHATASALVRKGRANKTVPSVTTFGRPTGTGIYAIEDLGVGSDFLAACNKVLTLAAAPNGRRTLTLPEATYSANGFAMSSNYIGFLVPAGVDIVGSGPNTIFQVAPDTITQAQVDAWVPPIDQYPSTNALDVMCFVAQTGLQLKQFTVKGTQQRVGGTGAPAGYDTYTYNGLRIQGAINPVLTDLWIKGIPGYRNSPPGETFGINIYKGSGAKLYRVDMDGRKTYGDTTARIGAAGVGFNTTSNVYLADCAAHHMGFSHGFAFWETNGIETHNCVAENNGQADANGVALSGVAGDGFNMERSRNSVHYSPRVGNNTLCELRYYARNDGDEYDGDTTGHYVYDLVLTDGGPLNVRIDNAQETLPIFSNSPSPVYSVN